MATWKDGPEYAPTHRPAGFATPEADPLDVAPPRQRTTPGSIPPPAQYHDVPAPPLTQIGREAAPHRSPREPFDVASASMTSVATLPDGERDPRAAFDIASSSMTAQAPSQLPPPPPDARPLSQGIAPPPPPPMPPAPSQPQAQPPAVRPQQTYQPARQWQPETGQWQPTHPQRRTDDSTQPLVHLVTGMAFVGMLLPSTAPILLTIAGAIAAARVVRLREIGYFTAALGGVFVLVQLLTQDSGFDPIYALAAFGALIAFIVKGYFQKRR